MAEIISCPSCQRKLQVPEQFFGQMVQCPQCQHRFVAASLAVSAQSQTPSPSSSGRGSTNPSRRPSDEAWIDEPRPRRRSRHADEFDEDDDDDEFDRPRRLRRHSKPHRGGMILALGLVSLVGGGSLGLPFVIGPVAWAMGSYDLREIREGRMDPAGEGMTRAGQVLGIFSTVFLVLGTLCLGFLLLAG